MCELTTGAIAWSLQTGHLQYHGWELQGMDVDEEEEDNDADTEEIMEEVVEEGEEVCDEE